MEGRGGGKGVSTGGWVVWDALNGGDMSNGVAGVRGSHKVLFMAWVRVSFSTGRNLEYLGEGLEYLGEGG